MRTAALIALLFVAGAADAAQIPRAQAVRVSSAPAIDGRVDDEAWTAAPMQDSFTQIEPEQGAQPSEKTQFQLAYDDAHLYIAVHCLDSQPRRIASRLTRRDRDIEADWVAISIDSRNDRNSALLFQLSAAGVQVDGQVFNDTDTSLDWDAVWNGAVARDEHGWYAEFAIPLTVLRFSSDDVQTWGLQVHRNVSRKREQMMWSVDGSGKTWGVSHFGYVEGLRGLRPRRTFELRPYIAAALASSNEKGGGFLGVGTDAQRDPRLELGADLKVGLTPRLILDLTLNPDFGQVEADTVVLNLSRFETFFPEKRPFFLEGTDIFATTIQLFYPRRIGRPLVGLGPGATLDDDDGIMRTVTDVDTLRLWTAAKMAGELGGGVSIGALAALVGSEDVNAVDELGESREIRLAPMRMFGVLRTRLALGGGSYVGLTGTSATRLDGHVRRVDADHDGYVQAADAFLKSREGRLIAQAQVAVSERVGGPSFRRGTAPCTAADAETDPECVPIARADGTRMGPGAVGVGVQARSNYETSRNLLKIEYTGHTAKFDPNDAGFAPRFNLNELKLIGGFMKKKPDAFTNFRGLFPFAAGSLSMDGTPQSLYVGADIEATFRNFTFTSPEQWINLPGTFDIYETFDGARFERVPGLEGYWSTQTNKANRVALTANLGWLLGFEDGVHNVNGELIVDLQAASNVELSLGASAGIDRALRFFDCTTESGRSCLVESGVRHYRFADLDSRFLSLTLRATWTLRPELSFQAYGQYFVAEGEFGDYRAIDTMGAKPEIRRGDLRPSDFDGDSDGDGAPDGNFETASVNANVVMRWEPRPGSTLYAVYTRAQESPVTSLSKLNRGPTEDVVLVKFVYFID